ncbi:MAG: CoA-transferase [Planctomycetaceae bacterium]
MESRAEGGKPLFMDPDAWSARTVFRAKSKGRRDKVTTVADAVARLVSDGDYLATGGFGGDRIPTAVVHEIVRQQKQSLGFAGHTATHDFQVLCAGNQTGRGQLLRQVDAAYIVGLESRGLSPHARRVVESGEVDLCEWTNYSLALRFQAAAMGVSFLPVASLLGTDTFAHSAARMVTCPFTQRDTAAVPALWPDVAAIHVHEADRLGNCRIRGTSVVDWHLARAAKRVIISCERLISEEEIRRDPTATAIPFFCVDAVCEVPFGSYPGNMPYEYYSDEQHLQNWLEVESSRVDHLDWVKRHIFDAASFDAYLEMCGGLPRLRELRNQELFP